MNSEENDKSIESTTNNEKSRKAKCKTCDFLHDLEEMGHCNKCQAHICFECCASCTCGIISCNDVYSGQTCLPFYDLQYSDSSYTDQTCHYCTVKMVLDETMKYWLYSMEQLKDIDHCEIANGQESLFWRLSQTTILKQKMKSWEAVSKILCQAEISSLARDIILDYYLMNSN